MRFHSLTPVDYLLRPYIDGSFRDCPKWHTPDVRTPPVMEVLARWVTGRVLVPKALRAEWRQQAMESSTSQNRQRPDAPPVADAGRRRRRLDDLPAPGRYDSLRQ